VLLNKQAFLFLAFSCSTLNPPQSYVFLKFISFHTLAFRLTIPSEEIAIAIVMYDGVTTAVKTQDKGWRESDGFEVEVGVSQLVETWQFQGKEAEV
jgi:hypothetical protein